MLFAVRQIEEARKEQFGIAADPQSGNPSKQPDELRVRSLDAVLLHTEGTLFPKRRSLGMRGGCSPLRSLS
jgi:hypothetical protein